MGIASILFGGFYILAGALVLVITPQCTTIAGTLLVCGMILLALSYFME